MGYTARARRRVYVDGVAGTEYDAFYLGDLQFSPDAKHILYIVGGVAEGAQKAAFVVVNGREGKRYDEVFRRADFDDEGRGVRYTAQSGRKFYSVRASIEETAR
jgi:hypothetical protein